MKSANKTKQELIDELAALRARVSELEKHEKISGQALENSGGGMNRPVPQTTCMQEAIFVVFDRKLDFINDGFTELFGVTSEEACGSNFDPMSLIAPESRCFIRELYREACRSTFTTKLINFAGLSKDGLKIECETLLLLISYKWGIAIQGTLQGLSVNERIDRTLPRHDSDVPGALSVIPTVAPYADKVRAQDLRNVKDEMPIWSLFNAFANHTTPKATLHV